MPPDLLECFLDAIEPEATEAETAPPEPFAVLRNLIATHGEVFQAWEPIYKHLRARPVELAELTRRVREVRATRSFRGLAHRCARDAQVRGWALDQIDVDTRPLLASLDESREALRRAARERIDVFVRAEAQLRFRALASLATVSGALDECHDSRVRAHPTPTRRLPFEAPRPLSLPWRAATGLALACGVACGALALGFGSSPARSAAASVAAGTVPVLFLPHWVRRRWLEHHLQLGDPLEPVVDATAPRSPLEARARFENVAHARAARNALERTVIAPTAAHLRELLGTIALDERDDEASEGFAAAARDDAILDRPSLASAARVLREVCDVARVPRLVPETPAATAFVRGFVDNASVLQALCDRHAPSAFEATTLGGVDDLGAGHWSLSDPGLDELIQALEQLGFSPGDDLDPRRIGAMRVFVERMPPAVQSQIESAIFELVDGLCRRWTTRVMSWCERMAERSQLAAIETSDSSGEERLVEELHDLAYRVRLTEIKSDEVRRDLVSATRAASVRDHGAASMRASASE